MEAYKTTVLAIGLLFSISISVAESSKVGGHIRWYDKSYLGYRSVEDSVVRVSTPDSAGSGVYVNRAIIATNAHVVRDYKNVQIRVSEGRPFNAKVYRVFKDIDIALIEVGNNEISNPVIIKSTSARRGEKIVSQGFPQGRYVLAKSTGTIIDVRECCIIHNALIAAGSSGGPLFDQRGELIGINTLLQKGIHDRANENDLSIAVSIPYILSKIGGGEFTYRLFYLPNGEVIEVSPSDLSNKEVLDRLMEQSAIYLNKRKNKNIFYLPNGDIFDIEPDISDEEAYGILMRKESRYLFDRMKRSETWLKQKGE